MQISPGVWIFLLTVIRDSPARIGLGQIGFKLYRLGIIRDRLIKFACLTVSIGATPVSPPVSGIEFNISGEVG